MFDIPELRSTASSLRISPEIDVPVSRRVKRLIDTAAFRRLSRISQLGLVSFVYPGATHSRFEHSLGVYRNAIQFVNHLQHDRTFAELMDRESISSFLLAALLHDIGHWPFCHAIEDMKLPGIPRHELLAKQFIERGELADCIERDWQLDPQRITRLLEPSKPDSVDRRTNVLISMLSGPIDIDKLDYLERDSLHAGVPYGRNFDRNRLIRSLCIDPSRSTLALTEKGKTATEMMVFARYIMFSEVYWHHAVRSATAMLQRVVYEICRTRPNEIADEWLRFSDFQMMEQLRVSSLGKPWQACLEGLFGEHRVLYKRIAQFDCLSQPEWHTKLARRPFEANVETSSRLAAELAKRLKRPVSQYDILIDAPPVKLEVQFQIDVLTSEGQFRPLRQLSPMVESLATRQFDDIVKRVRIVASPEVARWIRDANISIVDTLAASV